MFSEYCMNISDYPGDEEIAILEQAVSILEKAHDWQAAYHAMLDLSYEKKKREDWIKENVDN